MGTPQNIRKGMRSSRSARPEPQSDWDCSYSQRASPRFQREDSHLRVEMMISHRAKAEVEEVVSEGRTLEDMPPQQQIPQRRGRPRKNKEAGETQVPSEPCARSVVEELLMHAIRLEPVEGTSQESGSRMRRTDAMGTNVRESTQQLKQAQLAIVELYQENRELRRQLAAKTLEVSASQGREGNVTWLKRQLREAQDTIVQLREAQRTSKTHHHPYDETC
jgi:hypothetical protein